MWRMDTAWTLLKSEVPHLKRLPSEYIREHVYLTTQPVEEPHKPQQFLQMLEQFGDMVDHILFASDYPHWDSDDPDIALPNSLLGRRASRRSTATTGASYTGSDVPSTVKYRRRRGRRDPARRAQDRPHRRPIDRRVQRRRRILRDAQPLSAPGRRRCAKASCGACCAPTRPARSSTTLRKQILTCVVARLGVRHPDRPVVVRPQRLRVRSYSVGRGRVRPICRRNCRWRSWIA